MFHYADEIARKELRESIDLTQHERGIRAGLLIVFPDLINVRVRSNQYEFDLPEEASDG